MFSLISIYGLAQVEDYKMRQEVSSHQLKEQAFGSITQRGTIMLEPGNQFNPLNSNTNLYLTNHGSFNQDIYFRNRKFTNEMSIDNVLFSTEMFISNMQLFSLINKTELKSIEALYGANVMKPSSPSGQITAFSKKYSIFSPMDSIPRLGLYVLVRKSTNQFDFSLSKTFTNITYINSTSIFMNYADRYHIGQSNAKGSWGFLPLVANIYNGAGTGAWMNNLDSGDYKFTNRLLGIENRFSIKLKNHGILNTFIHFSAANSTQIGKLNQQVGKYTFSETNTVLQPTILTYIQLIKKDDESKFYTQLNYALTYQLVNNKTEERLDINDAQIINQNVENKLSFQVNGYKNLNARHVFYYGGMASSNFISNKNSTSDLFSVSLNTSPILQGNIFYRHEYRPSSDVSLFYGGNFGVEYFSMKYQPFLVGFHKFMSPKSQINLSWTRHSCESSNYSINLFLKFNSPTINDVKPIYSEVFFKPNENLKSEKEIFFEGNFYRKFEDKLEINISPYLRITRDAFMQRDNSNNPSEWIQISAKKYFTLETTNIDNLEEIGFLSEIKFHASNSFLIFTKSNFNYSFNPLPKNILSKNLPFYGDIGVKIKLKKVYAELWSNFNLGNAFDSSITSRYIQDYSLQYNFPGYILLHAQFHTELYKQLIFNFRLENILDQNYRSYLSTIHGLGRNVEVQLNYKF